MAVATDKKVFAKDVNDARFNLRTSLPEHPRPEWACYCRLHNNRHNTCPAPW